MRLSPWFFGAALVFGLPGCRVPASTETDAPALDASMDAATADVPSATADAPTGDASMDATRPDAPGLSLAHYAQCTRTEDCPAGDVCGYHWPGAGPVPTPPPVSYCQPPCATAADCAADAYGDPSVRGMCDGASGRCLLYCAIGGLVPTCVAPYFCAYYVPRTPRDGYCVLDPDAPPPFDAGAPPDAGTFDPDASLPMSTCVGPACPVSLSVGALGGCVVRQDGEPRCWGVDGDGDLTGVFPPRGGPPSPDFLEGATVPGFPATVRSMEVGDSMGAIVGTTAWLWGRFAMREPTPDMNNLPRELAGAEGMAQLAITQWHVCGLLSDGRVACFGRNTGGELGDGTFTTTLVPSPVPDLTDVVQVATGTSGAGGSSCALHSDGTVDCWGALPSGVATTPQRIARAAPAIELALGTSPAGADSHFHAVLRDGTLVGWGENRLSELGVATPSVVREPAPIPGLPRVVDVAAGSGHACALAIDGSVWCWGSNDLGQVGIGGGSSCLGGAPCVRTPVLVPGISGGVALDAGGNRTCVLDRAGDVWCWGAGPLGDGSPTTMATPTPTRVIFP